MKYTPEQLELFHKALNERICSLCREKGYEDVCRIGKSDKCAIDTHLEGIVTAVLATPTSDKIADYLPGLRATVCSHCENQDELGRCEAREHAYCNLDSLFPIVVETVEEVAETIPLAAGKA